MERIKKNIFQKVIIEAIPTMEGEEYIITPDLTVVYHMKIGLISVGIDVGFLDAEVLQTNSYEEDIIL